MSTAPFLNFSPPFVNGVHEAASYHASRKGLLGILRGTLTASKIRRGDHYFSRTRSMIKEHYPGLPLKDRNNIHFEFRKVVNAQEALEGAQNIIEKFTRARKYERVSRAAFIIVEEASNRADVKNVMVQFSTNNDRGRSSPPPPGPQRPSTPTPSTFSDPFGDSHAISTLSDIDISNVELVEMTRYESEPTGEGAIIVEMQDQDGTTREFVTTYPLDATSGHSAALRVEAASTMSGDGHSIYGPSEASGNVAR